MNEQIRNRRLRLLIGRLNRARRQQAKQIDILCNDLIVAQKQFIKELKVIGFAADFYGGIAGLTDTNELLGGASVLIQEQIPGANIAFFLLTEANFEMHIFESDRPIELDDKRIENFFTREVVESIAKSNRLCGIEEMLAMGLEGNPRCLEKVAAAGFPLNSRGSCAGFILLYRASKHPFTPEELKSVEQITPGFSRTITACRVTADITISQ